MITISQQNIVKETVQFFVDIANEALVEENNKPLDSLNISYDLKGTTAGRAIFDTKTIKLNKILIEENFNNFLNDIIPHEVAHIVTDYFYGIQHAAHGKAWKSVMKNIFKIKPKRLHSMDVTNSIARNTKKFIYVCPRPCNQTFNISTTIHNRIKRGHIRICRSCKKELIFTCNETDKVALIAQEKLNK